MKTAILVASRIVLAIAILCTLLFTFYQSSLTPEQSNEVSSGVSDVIEPVIPSDSNVGKNVHSNISLIGHFIEFFFLGFFVSLYFSLVLTRDVRPSRFKFVCMLSSLTFGTVLAVIDESIQILSSRTSDVVDILVDSLGYLISSVSIYCIYFIFFLVLNLILRHKSKHRI